MSNLDEKLRTLLAKNAYMLEEWNGDDSFEDYAGLVSGLIAQIKQAFQDEGYLTPEQAVKVQEIVNQMAETATKAFHMPTVQYVVLSDDQRIATPVCTGQEWYDRFMSNMPVNSIAVREGDTNFYYMKNEVDEAAKKAAGLDN